MVVYDDQTPINARRSLDRGMLAALRIIDDMEPKAIGLDILFDQPQDEDAELIATLRAMQTPTLVGYANFATNQADIVYDQQVYLEEFLAQLEGSNARPASIRLDNTHGVTRKWPSIEPDLPPVLGRAMLREAGEADSAFPGYEGSLRYRHPVFENGLWPLADRQFPRSGADGNPRSAGHAARADRGPLCPRRRRHHRLRPRADALPPV